MSSDRSDEVTTPPGADAEELKRIAAEQGLSEDQVKQLARSTGTEGTDLDEAAAAAARWS